MAVEESKDQEMGDGIQCINHPYSKNPGGICAICLQEKLGKLVSSSNFPTNHHLHESSSSSSFRSNSFGSSASGPSNLSFSVAVSGNNSKSEAFYCSRRKERPPKLLFSLAKKKKEKKMMTSSSTNRTAEIVYRRSKSAKTPRRATDGEDFSTRKRSGFWSFLHISSSKNQNNNRSDVNLANKNQSEAGFSKIDEIEAAVTNNSDKGLSESDKIEAVITQSKSFPSSSSSLPKTEENSQNCSNGVTSEGESGKVSSFERKVSRSRSVGCGSRSFSGDFFGRISNGFGDCALRRVESQREGETKDSSNNSKHNSSGMRDMIRCGGIFGGFLIMASNSSSSTSSSSSDQHHVNGRNRSRGWAFSPLRASSVNNKSSSSSATSVMEAKRTQLLNTTLESYTGCPV